MRTNFARAIYRKLADSQLTQADLARMSGLAQSTIARIIGEERRPDIHTLEALCNAWNDAPYELGLLCEHLRDEITRAGKRESDVLLHPKDAPRPNHEQLDADIEVIRSEAIQHRDMHNLIADMAAIVRRHRSRHHLDIAADDRPEYPAK